MTLAQTAPLGDLVRRHRRALGWTQEQLAERAGLSERAIRDIERGTNHLPRQETVRLLADALELAGAERDAFQTAARLLGESQRLTPIAPSPTRTNLPDEHTPFIGRQREVGEVINLFVQRAVAVRLVTLTGTGGTGKTRLALRVAAELLPWFEDGVFLVSLASLSDPALVPSAIAESVGIRERGSISAVDALTAHLRNKRLLLILDNLEHLLDAAPLIGDLLDTCHHLHILTTSRIPLNLEREHAYAVPPLRVPDPARLPALDQLGEVEAVALFLERARAAAADFALTDENAPAVAEICHRLDGLPLALVLAAARTRLFPPAALLHRLSRRLPLLTGGARDSPARHQTLRAAIDWSYSLLTEGERDLFARLSVFAGGCTLEAIEAVCHPDGDRDMDTLAGVNSLVENSLLRRQGQEEPRFVLLETIREYAAERLTVSGMEKRLQGRHAGYFLGMAEDVAPQLKDSNRGPALNRLADEHDNLRAALQWAQEQDEFELGLRLAVALSRFWEVRGHLAEGSRRLTALLPAAETLAPGLRAAALVAAGTLASSVGKLQASTDLIERSLIVYRQLGDTQASAEVLDRFAYQSFMWGCGSQAIAALEDHLTWGQKVGDKLLVATSLHWLASATVWERDAGRARTLAEESLALYQDLGDTTGTIDALLILAHAAYSDGDVRAARARCEEITAGLPRVSLKTSTRERIQFVAYKAREAGDYEYATRLLDGAVTRALEVDDRRNAAYARTCLALLAREQGEHGRAEALYRESLAVFQEIEDRWGSGGVLLGLGDVARDRGEAEAVVTLCGQALELGREIGSPMQMGFALHNLALAARAKAQYKEAEELLDESLAVFQGPPDARAELLCSAGLVALDLEQCDRAEQTFTESLLTTRDVLTGYLGGTLLEGLAGVAVGRGQPDRAGRLLGAAAALRAAMGTPIPPVNRPRHERDMAAARAALGAETFERLADEGRAMTAKQAVSYALGEATPC